MTDYESLREVFIDKLTKDSETKDRRRRGYNQAIFSPDGWPMWTSIDLHMVMEAFDKAVKDMST